MATPDLSPRATVGRPRSIWTVNSVPFSASSSCSVRPGLRWKGSRKARLKSTPSKRASISLPE